jgi:hypothetical protein
VPDVELVELDADEARLATELAEATYERHRHHGGHYPNLARSHRVGKLGEVAVDNWLTANSLTTDPAYRDPTREREPDLMVNGCGVAVKSWRPDTWTDWGRCVTPAQLPGMRKKIRAIVWAIVDDERDPIEVEVAGWSTPDEVAETELRATGPSYRPIVNHQVDIEALRDIASLVEFLCT